MSDTKSIYKNGYQVNSLDKAWSLESKVLILGTSPSVKSRGKGYYLNVKKNLFWKIMSKMFGVKIPNNDEIYKESIKTIVENGIALWDVNQWNLFESDGTSSNKKIILDGPINRIDELVNNSKICVILCNGKDAYRQFETGKDSIGLNSIKTIKMIYTSERAGRASAEKLEPEELIDKWISTINKYLN